MHIKINEQIIFYFKLLLLFINEMRDYMCITVSEYIIIIILLFKIFNISYFYFKR